MNHCDRFIPPVTFFPPVVTFFPPVRLLLAWLYVVCLSNFSIANEDIVFEFPARVENVSITYSVTKGELERMPEWGPEAENPPLSARRAKRLSIQIIDRKVRAGNISRYVHAIWRVQRLTLRMIEDEKWLWIVEFELEPKTGTGLTGVAPQCQIALSMSGKLIRSTVDPIDSP